MQRATELMKNTTHWDYVSALYEATKERIQFKSEVITVIYGYEN